MAEGMKTLQLYVSEDLWNKLRRTFGEGRVSANVEKILRQHIGNPAEEKKLALMELNKQVRRFNADFDMRLELREEEMPPMPPKEEQDARC